MDLGRDAGPAAPVDASGVTHARTGQDHAPSGSTRSLHHGGTAAAETHPVQALGVVVWLMPLIPAPENQCCSAMAWQVVLTQETGQGDHNQSIRQKIVLRM